MGERRLGAARGSAPCIAAALTLVLALVAGGAGSAAGPATAGSGAPEVDVVVAGPDAGVVADVVAAAGGEATAILPRTGTVIGRLPTGAVAAVAAHPAVAGAAVERQVVVVATGDGADDADGAELPEAVHREVLVADALHNRGITGTGVTVALVDTGVSDLPQLSHAVVPVTVGSTTTTCVNLSGEPGCADSYGHGTFLAGLIAGRDTSRPGPGVAPGARVLSVKIAGRDGSADIGTVLAAIEWVVSHRATYGIRVLNLSLGTDSTQSYRIDPLNYAVQRAWEAGLVVVVAASNRGPDAGTISKPGDDPWVITVGAIDDRGTVATGDDAVPDFSARGPTAADGLPKPDVVAPGARLVSLRAPGSSIDEQVPPATDDPVYRAGSGTSMAAALVSGVAALAIEADPAVSPDRVKYAVGATARPAASDDAMAVGAGLVDAEAAALHAPPGLANQGLSRSSADGSLAGSRGTVVVRPVGRDTPVVGEETQQLRTFDRGTFRQRAWSPTSWTGSAWHGFRWYTSAWHGSSWSGSSWSGSSWSATSWYGSSWYGSSWYGAWE